MTYNVKFRLRTLITIVTMSCVAMGGCITLLRQVAGPVIPDSRFRLLHEGMTAEAVQELIGEPSRIRRSDPAVYPCSETWIYERPMNPGWVEIGFDSAGRVNSINDESVVPPHQRGRSVFGIF